VRPQPLRQGVACLARPWQEYALAAQLTLRRDRLHDGLRDELVRDEVRRDAVFRKGRSGRGPDSRDPGPAEVAGR
jgi:hypothetical protein